jgi:hypothetical protein
MKEPVPSAKGSGVVFALRLRKMQPIPPRRARSIHRALHAVSHLGSKFQHTVRRVGKMAQNRLSFDSAFYITSLRHLAIRDFLVSTKPHSLQNGLPVPSAFLPSPLSTYEKPEFGWTGTTHVIRCIHFQ